MAREVNLGKVVGPAGPQGPAGATGGIGPTGPKGADGRSAYAIAVEGGYTGTEAEFNALLSKSTPIRYIEHINIQIAVADWNTDSSYSASGYKFRAYVVCIGVRETDTPTVLFNPSEALSGNYATFCESVHDGIYIWAKEKPFAPIMINAVFTGKI